jgi:hypothetical protein
MMMMTIFPLENSNGEKSEREREREEGKVFLRNQAAKQTFGRKLLILLGHNVLLCKREREKPKRSQNVSIK